MAQTHARLKALKPGKIVARGWLREQLLRNRDGIGGHLDELEPVMILKPYITRETEARWGEKIKAGWGAEISGNYWTGEIALAFALDDEWLKKKAENWVNAVLAAQRADGYMGTYTEGDDFFDDYNAWGTACGMNALLLYYEATGREDVLRAVHRCLLWFCDNWAGDRKTRYVGVHIVRPMTVCYRYTGDDRLIKFCEEYYDFLEKNDLFGKSLGVYLSDTLQYGSDHGAGYAITMTHPAELYDFNGDPRYLKASVNAYEKLRAKMLQKTGGITCDCEYLSPLGMVVETEYCAITIFNKAMAEMLRITGEPRYADEMERTVFNAAEGARKKDERAIAYMSTPNQIFATKISSQTARHAHQAYSPCHPTACCAVMSVRVLPEFVSAAAYTDDKGNPYICIYAPCQINFDDFSLSTDTDYPFRDRIDYRISCGKKIEKTFYFRIPGWCSDAKIYVNGKHLEVDCPAGAFAEVWGGFSDGDVISLEFPMKVRVGYLDDTDRSKLYPICFEYGPLLFALPIEENWEVWEGESFTPLPEGWNWYNVSPKVKKSTLDVYEEKGMRRWLLDYNVAVDENISPEDISVELCGIGGYPWEDPPVRLHLEAYKAPYSYPPYPYRTLEPYCVNGRSYVSGKQNITLVPYGCTALRITYFPRAELNR